VSCTTKDKVLKRLAKLRAMAEHKSSNQHEAERAAQEMARLMMQYEIDEGEVSGELDAGDLEAVADIPWDPDMKVMQRNWEWRNHLADGCARAMGCTLYVRGRRGGGCTAHFVGRPSELSAARYMYEHFSGVCERLADAAWKAEHKRQTLCGVEPGPAAGRSYKGAFRLGFARAVQWKIAESRKQAMADLYREGAGRSGALVRIEKKQADIDNLLSGMSLGSKPTRDPKNLGAYMEGTSAGREQSVDSRARGALAAPAKRVGQ
jgi:hypothetical protein